jgi:hypothetical protein
MFMRDDGTVKFRTIDPFEIKEFEFHPEDKETILAYKRVSGSDLKGEKDRWYADANYYEQLEDKVDGETSQNELEEGVLLFYFKYGYRDGYRGEQPLLPILRYDRIYEDVLLDLARLYHERSSVVWILRILGNNSNVFSRSDTPVKGAKYKIETDFKRWRIEDTKLSDFNSSDYARPHRLAMAAGVGIPEYAVFQDSSNQSYASLRRADGPLSLLTQSTQNMWCVDVAEMVRVILRELVARRQIEATYKISKLPFEEIIRLISIDNLQEAELIAKDKNKLIEVDTVDLPIAVIFPKLQNDNPLLFAQSLSVLILAGVLSRRTAMKMLGVDPDNELSLISLDPIKLITQAGTGKTEQPETNYDRKMDKGTE